ncbi:MULTISPECIES: hypothetical protein [unclassified Methylobacterium]|jgi:hypothetical protein|uniref:hypothetical protein n=1 Tax=unclassified Methylobacterium TaxID=2615210 RepID=UPI0004636ECC|nr:hypothetical protein [Methylobacterium sp. 2A]MWV23528.1 hypothetical protein [Methylobacterium sp. 2A]
MTLDPKRLARDAKRVQATRPTAGIGRETTGVTRAVRDGLPMIRQLRASGITWAAIAAAMSAQGVTQGAGKPLTASRLTAIVGQVEAQLRRQAERAAARRARPDLADPKPPLAGDTATPAPVAPVPNTPSPAPGRPAHTSEEAIRRAGLDALHKLLKKA